MKYNALLIMLIGSLFFACGKKESNTNNTQTEESTPITIVLAKQEVIKSPVLASGIVSSGNEVKPSFKIGGIIMKTFFEEGDFVRKGQLLATLNQTEIAAQSQQASEGLTKAKRDLERAENLYRDSVATLEQVQNAKTGVAIAEQNVSIVQFNQAYSEVRSPISGKVIKQLMHQGEVVGPGMPVCYILGTNVEDWVIKVGLADRDWARLHVGDKAIVRLDAYAGRQFEAMVTQLADVANPQNGTFDAELKIKTHGERLAAGLVAAVEIQPRSAAPQIILPIETLVESDGMKATVYTVDNQNIVHKNIVYIGQLFKDKIVVASGIPNGAQVVLQGAPYMSEGKKVNIIK